MKTYEVRECGRIRGHILLPDFVDGSLLMRSMLETTDGAREFLVPENLLRFYRNNLGWYVVHETEGRMKVACLVEVDCGSGN